MISPNINRATITHFPLAMGFNKIPAIHNTPKNSRTFFHGRNIPKITIRKIKAFKYLGPKRIRRTQEPPRLLS
ncbi:hypothetical protein LguiB_031064 [Lonicera macranthoides]